MISIQAAMELDTHFLISQRFWSDFPTQPGREVGRVISNVEDCLTVLGGLCSSSHFKMLMYTLGIQIQKNNNNKMHQLFHSPFFHSGRVTLTSNDQEFKTSFFKPLSFTEKQLMRGIKDQLLRSFHSTEASNCSLK